VQFEESSDSVDTEEQVSPAVPMFDPLGLLDGLPDGEDGDSPDQSVPSEPNTGAGEPATASNHQPARDTPNDNTAASTNDVDQAGGQTSDSGGGDSTTSDSAGGGAAAGAPGGSSPGGSDSDPDPGNEPAPPAGDDEPDDDEPDEDEQGLLEQVLCLLFC
jgi:hypothetical protein